MTEKKRGGLRSPAGGRPRKEPTVVLSFRVPEKYKDIIKQHIDNLLKNTIMSEKKAYAVFGLFNALNVMGIKSNLPKGQYIIPVFDDYDEAKKYAGEKFEVVELSIPNKPE